MNRFQGTLKYFAAKMRAFQPSANATRLILCAAALFALGGCKHKHPSEETASKIVLTPKYASGPTNFIAQISQTDHFILVPRFRERMPSLRNYAFKISGNHLNQVLVAIASLEGPPPIHSSSTAAYDWEIQFCRGPEILAKAYFQNDGVLIGSVEYQDRSGELGNLYGMVQEDSNRWIHDHQK